MLLSYRNILKPIPRIGQEPPTEFCILPKGELETADGLKLHVDDASMASIMDAFKSHGTDFMLDWEHGSEASSGELAHGGAPAAAWGKLETRNDGIWMAEIVWTPTAHKQVQAGEFRYFSPVLYVDDGHVIGLKSGALTNIPRISDLTPLMAAKDKTMTEKIELKDMGLEEHAKALKAHGDMMKEHGSDMKEMHKEHMKTLKELISCMPSKEKAKDDDDADDSDDSDKEEAKMKTDVEACKGAIDAAVGSKLTPGEAKEFKAKLEKGEMTPAYIAGYLSAAKVIAEVAPATPPAMTFKVRFDETQLAKAKPVSKIEGWKGTHKSITSAQEAEAHLTQVCKAAGVKVDDVAKTWAESAERFEQYKAAGMIPNAR